MLGIFWALLVADHIVLLRVSGPARVGVYRCMLEEERESNCESTAAKMIFFAIFLVCDILNSTQFAIFFNAVYIDLSRGSD